MYMKKLLCLLLALMLLMMLSACGEPKIVSCDRCGAEIEVDKKSNITDDWIVFCKDCEEEIGPIVE